VTPKEAHRTDADVQRRVEEIISGAQAEAARIVTEAREHAARDQAAIDRLVTEGVAKARADELQVKADVKRASFAELAAQAQAAKSFFERALEVCSALHAAAHAEQRVQELTAEVECVKAQLVQAQALRDAVLRERDAIEQRLPALRAEAEGLEGRIAVAKARIAALINGVQQ
jgi:chromosome segregation ATPase